MQSATAPSLPPVSQPTTPQLSTGSKLALHLIVAAASWATLILVVLITALLAGWVMLAVILLGGLTKSQPLPVIPVLVVLLTVATGLAWLVARYVAAPRRIGLVITCILALVSVIGTSWALSAPDDALFLARDMAWDGADVWQVQQFPERVVHTAPPVFQFQQNLRPDLFQTIEYKQNGQLTQASFEEFLTSSQSTSFIVIKDNAILYEGYFNGYARDVES